MQHTNTKVELLSLLPDELAELLVSIGERKYRAEQIVSEAGSRADSMVENAKVEADLERRRAVEGIKREIVDVSAALAEKMLEREIDTKDHRALIDSFIEKIGEDDEGNL